MARHRERSTISTSGGPLGSAPPDTVVVHGEGVRVDRVDAVPRAEAHSRYGGVDALAVLAGTLAAIGSAGLLSAVLGAVTTVGYAQGTGAEQVPVLAIVAGLLVLAVSLLAGGWTAGRCARYEGGRNGLLVGVLFSLLAAALGAAANANDRVRDLGLPRFLADDLLTVAALASLVTALIVTLGAAVLGGRLGVGWHRKVDDALLSTQPGGLAPYPDGSGQ